MKNTLILGSLLLSVSLGAQAATFEEQLAAEQASTVGAIHKVAAKQKPIKQAFGGLTYTAECWNDGYPSCRHLGFAEQLRKKTPNPIIYVTPENGGPLEPHNTLAFLDDIFLHSITLGTFQGTPLEAEVLEAATGAAIKNGSDKEHVVGLFNLLRMATVVPSQRRVNAAVKTRWILVQEYAELCEKYKDICYPNYFQDFYTIAKEDYSPRTRVTALAFIYYLETNQAKRTAALKEMALRDGESAISVDSDGKKSLTPTPLASNRAFAKSLLESARVIKQTSWTCFAGTLKTGGALLGIHGTNCQ
jgi:hypothetical protein